MEDKAVIIEMLLAEAIEKIGEIPPIVKGLNELDSRTNGIRAGKAIYELTEIRKEIYKHWPSLKSEFEKDSELDYEKYKKLSDNYLKAYHCEQEKLLDEADALFRKLRKNQESSYFKQLAEAALFRISEAKNA